MDIATNIISAVLKAVVSNKVGNGYFVTLCGDMFSVLTQSVRDISYLFASHLLFRCSLIMCGI